MKKLIIALVLSGPLWATDVLTPIIGSGFCTVTNVSSATPALITVNATSECGLANDSIVWVHGIRNSGGFSPVNLHQANAADTNGLCRVAKSVTATQFTLRACDGTTNITNGGGTYASQGMVARGQWRTLNPLPQNPFFDANLVTCLSDTSSTGCAFASRPEYTRLLNAISGICDPLDMTVKHGDFIPGGTPGVCGMLYAYKWLAEGSPGSSAARTKMINAVTNTLPLPTAADAGVLDHIDSVASSYGDYAIEVNMTQFLKSLAISWPALPTGTKTFLEHYYNADFDYAKGGGDYDGSPITYDAFTVNGSAGTIKISAGATTILGTGTNFVSGHVGQYILIPRGCTIYARYFLIAAVNSTTSITLARPIDADLISDGPPGLGCTHISGVAQPLNYVIAPAWPDDGTKMGWTGLAMNNNYGMFCGSYPNVPACGAYGTGAGGAGVDPANNHQACRLGYQTLLHLVMAATGTSPRSQRRASDGLFIWYHVMLPWTKTMTAGLGSASAHYHTSRMMPLYSDVMGGIRNSFTDAPDFVNDPAWWDGQAKYAISQNVDRLNNILWNINGERANNPLYSQQLQPGLDFMLMQPTSTWAQYLKYFFYTDFGGSFGSTDSTGYIENRPSITGVQRTNTTMIGLTVPRSTCLAQWPASVCPTDRKPYMFSRSGATTNAAWNSAGVHIFFNASGTQKRDHEGQRGELGLMITAARFPLMMNDGDQGSSNSDHRHVGTFNLGAESNWKTGNNGIGTSEPMYSYEGATLGVLAVDITGQYVAGANVTFAGDAVFHMKPPAKQGFVFQSSQWASTTPLTASKWHHYSVSQGCGQSPTSHGCLTLSRSGATVSMIIGSNARLDSKFSGGTVNTENNSDTDCSYAAGMNFTCRVANQATGTSGKLWTVHRPSPVVTDAMPAISESDVGNHHVLEVKDTSGGTNYAVVAAIAPLADFSNTSLTYTTTYTATHGQVMVTGLVAATYGFTRNGVDVSGCTAKVVDANGIALCDDVGAAGTIVVSSGGVIPPPVTNLGFRLLRGIASLRGSWW